MKKMEEKNFVVKGTMKQKNSDQKFTKEIKAVNEGFAKEKALSLMGSKHNVKRNLIKILEVTQKKE